jgi:hypothetical protein
MPQKPKQGDRETAARDRRPEVVLDVVFEDGLLFLAVANIGDAPALAVSCTFARKLLGLGGAKDVSGLPLFANVAFLGPGREIRTLLDSSAAYFGRDEPTDLSVAIRYSGTDGRTYETTVDHDLAIYRELAYVPREVSRDA